MNKSDQTTEKGPDNDSHIDLYEEIVQDMGPASLSPSLFQSLTNVVSKQIWLKSDLYLRYRIEDLITPDYWSCSVLIILTNHSVTHNVTESRLNDFVIFKNNALRLKYAIWLVEIMMQCDWK